MSWSWISWVVAEMKVAGSTYDHGPLSKDILSSTADFPPVA